MNYSDDVEASWLKKGKKLLYGYSTVVLTDEEGFVEYATTNSANVNESAYFEEFINDIPIKEGQKLLYDKGVDSKKNISILKNKKIQNGIMKKATKNKKLSTKEKLRNKLIGAKRFVVERTFGTMKRSYGMDRALYLGTEKVNSQFVLRAIAYNLTRAKNKFLSFLQPNCAQN